MAMEACLYWRDQRHGTDSTTCHFDQSCMVTRYNQSAAAYVSTLQIEVQTWPHEGHQCKSCLCFNTKGQQASRPRVTGVGDGMALAQKESIPKGQQKLPTWWCQNRHLCTSTTDTPGPLSLRVSQPISQEKENKGQTALTNQPNL